MKPHVNLFLFVFWRKLKTPKRLFKIIWPLLVTAVTKGQKFHNENMISSHCPKYEWKIWKLLPWMLETEFFKFFCSHFGQWADFIFSFWNFLLAKSRFLIFLPCPNSLQFCEREWDRYYNCVNLKNIFRKTTRNLDKKNLIKTAVFS